MRTMMRLVVVVTLLLFGVGVVQGQDEIPADGGYVTDAADQFTAQQEQQLVQQMTRIELELDVVIAVVTVNNCGDDTSGYQDEIFNTWKVGAADKNNGLLIVYCLTPHSIEQGFGLGITDKFSEESTGEAAQEFFIPSVRAGNVFQGMQNLLNHYERDLKGEPTSSQPQTVTKKDRTSPFYTPARYVCAGMLILLILAVFLGGSTGSDSGSSYSGGSSSSSTSSSSSSSRSSSSSSNRGGSSGGGSSRSI